MNIYMLAAVSLVLSATVAFAASPVPDVLAYLLACYVLAPVLVEDIPVLWKKSPYKGMSNGFYLRATLSAISVAALVYAGFTGIAAFSAMVCLVLYAVLFDCKSKGEE